MAHSTTNLIHSIKVGSTTYEIHDAQAIHSIEELGLGTALVFKGVKDKLSDLALITDSKVGDVWHVKENDYEYVWAMTNGTTGSWEEFGAPHNFAAADHIHDVTVTGKNASSAVTGTATVTGGNSTSAVTGTAQITDAPKVTTTPVYRKVSTSGDTFVKSYPGATSKLVTTSIKPAGTATSVVNSVTPSTELITGVLGSTKASKATAGTAKDVAKAGSAVTVATRATSQTTVGNANVGATQAVVTGLKGGSQASWSASVNSGVLEFSFTTNTLQGVNTTNITPATTSTTKIYGCGDNTSVTPAVSNGTITPYTFSEVTVPVASEEITVVTGVTTGNTDVATVGTAVTLATGALSSSGTGSAVMTGLGTASTGSALVSATLVGAASESDGMLTGDDVSVTSQSLSGTISGTAAAQTWTQNTGSISGTAAAQTWTQQSGTTGQPK